MSDHFDSAELRRQLQAVAPDENRASGIPPACYGNDALLGLEREAIFLRGWIAFGRSDRWPRAGDYTALDIAGVPTIVVRNGDGELRAFANSCRHRGSRMLEGDGNCRKIKCPFHWWTYDLDGRLKVYSRMENAIDFDPADFGLVEFALAERHGFAFVSFAADMPPIDDWLQDFELFHGPWDLPRWRTTRVREFDVECNWKAFIEVFNEYYHLPMVHPDSISWNYPEPDAIDPRRGDYATQFGVTEGAAALMRDTQQYALPVAPGLDGRERSGTRYTWIFPNLTFALSQDSMWIYQAYPLDAAHCRVVQTVCFPESSLELADFGERAAHYYARIDAALDEDLPFLLRQQRGLESPFALPGRFAALEPAVGRFAYWYARQMLGEIGVGTAPGG